MHGKGLLILLLIHAGPTEFMYYWLHRALHIHSLYAVSKEIVPPQDALPPFHCAASLSVMSISRLTGSSGITVERTPSYMLSPLTKVFVLMSPKAITFFFHTCRLLCTAAQALSQTIQDQSGEFCSYACIMIRLYYFSAAAFVLALSDIFPLRDSLT